MILTLLTGLFFTPVLAKAPVQNPIFTTIVNKNVLLYEEPLVLSPIVRRTFVGEVLKIIGEVKTKTGETWGKVFLSPEKVAYIQGIYYTNNGSLKQKVWEPEIVLRSEKPFSFAAKGPAELFGGGVEFRYLPFTRLGVTFAGGSIIDEGQSKGYAVSYGAICMLSTKSFSPFISTGLSTLNFNDDYSSLQISSFYVNAGVEWILSNGYFIGAGITYVQSYRIQVAYDYSYVKANGGSLEVDQFGTFSGLNGSGSLQRFNPMLIMGYSF